MYAEQSGCRKPAVFLDRDGVLTVEKSYITSLEELTLFSYASECIKYIQEKGYYAIVITNQSGVARGLFTEDVLWKMNEYLKKATGVDAVYYCPHHPDGIAGPYRKICKCRKPETGLLEQACQDFEIDMDKSFMVGDRASDILAGQRMGIKTILLESGYGLKHLETAVMPNYVFGDLRDVLQIL